MSKDEMFSVVLESISDLRTLLTNACDLEVLLVNTDRDKDTLIEKSKKFVDDQCVIAEKLKKTFYNEYDKLVEPRIKEEVIPNESSKCNDNDDIPEDINKAADSTDPSASETADAKPSGKSIIRVVDLNKLLDPKRKKSVKFDSSIIILTSSEDDEPKSAPSKSKENGLKSAIKKTALDEDKEDDAESPNRSRKSSRLRSNQTKRELRKEGLKKIFKRSSDRNFEIVTRKSKRSCPPSSKSSDSSDSSDSDGRTDRSSDKFHIDEHKIDKELQITLPKIPVDQLKDVYETDRNVFEPQSGTQTKRTSGYESDTESNRTKKTKTFERRTNDEPADRSGDLFEDDENAADENLADESGINIKDNEPIPSETRIEDADKAANSQTSCIDSTSTYITAQSDNVSANEEETPREDDSSIRQSEKVEEKAEDEVIKSNECDEGSDSDSVSKNELSKSTKKSNVLSDSDEGERAARLSDSEDEQVKKKSKKKRVKKNKKTVISDSDDEDNDKSEKNKEASDVENDESRKSSEESAKQSEEDEEETAKKKKSRKSRIKKRKNSSSESEEVETRKHIRKVLDKNKLSESTLKAEEAEKERKARIAKKQQKYNKVYEETKDASVDEVVLDYEEKTKEPRLAVHKDIVKHLKPHQASGIQFMYDACFESVERTLKSPGSGCILAHSMGLGKTLQIVALTETLMRHARLTKVERVMVVSPVNTVLNWKAEYRKWLPKKAQVEVFELATSKKNYERQHVVKEWIDEGGVLIIGYVMFRNLSNPTNKKIPKKMRAVFHEGLVDPGPDLVVCDEGHLLKNEKTNLSIAMNRIKTARRIVLTGTPLQNNLREYWCMVQFIKPNLLGTYKEYLNRFVNPIINGQYTDSTQHDTVLMRKRSHVLHKLLDGVVQRRDYSVLEPYLPPKHEYVLFVRLSDAQVKLYKHYMEHYARKTDGTNRTSFLFVDFQTLQRICTHPRVLADKTKENKAKWDDEEDSEGSLKDFIDDGDDTSGASSTSNSSDEASAGSSDGGKRGKRGKARVTRAAAAQRKENGGEEAESDDAEMQADEVKKEWWQEYCDGDELDNVNHSGKLSLFFEILKECEEIGDKVLVFSQSLYTLNCIEYFLNKIDEATANGDTDKVGGYKGNWVYGIDYLRLDGSSSCDNRAIWCDNFNNPDNERTRLFLISTRAGGLGINLFAANRVIIFDVSWNPSHDIQSIYRVYRFGQTKPCYIYRFVTYGAMEMKIYERQVTKQAISKRVIDEQQIDRHYNQNDLQELYKCDLEPSDRPTPLVPKDVMLGEMLQKYANVLYKYHIHQSLLENKTDEGLNEEERKAAWEEFENEKELRKTYTNYANVSYLTNPAISSPQAINAALTNIVRRDNPTWSETQIKGIIPALVRQLQIQIEEKDMSMYQRVVQEIQIMNRAKLKETMYQQQMMNFYQQQMLKQKQQNTVLGDLMVNYQQLQNMFGANAPIPGAATASMGQQGNANRAGVAMPNYFKGPSTSAQNLQPSNDVIELND
ncbi:unnamed protein product [Phyllotreta striolata]|uniref:Transcriptional regulator ATRX homolog n=1 Tax=Phyllotreta striolata TaxID=444603 RepID=A0A9N9TP61_PHYSR|nr:unnamed protein product [Phyllotreta striolata]